MISKQVAKDAGNGHFPSQGVIYDRAGIEVDATGWVWKLNSLRPEALNFRRLNVQSAGLLASIALYLAELVQATSVDHVTNTFDALVYLHRSEHLRACAENGADIDERLISELRQIPRLADYRLGYVRAWYRWCAQQGLRQFSPETATRLDDLVIEHNVVGHAVRTRDPEKGAFDELEFIALTTALRASASSSVLDLKERTALWLAIGLGCNPLAYALLREEDYKPIVEHGTGRIQHMLYVPRIKKGDEEFRAQFHPEILNDEIGPLVAALIDQNMSRRKAARWSEEYAHPLFVASRPRLDLRGQLREYAMHVIPSDITDMLKNAVRKLGVKSHRTGGDLIVTARRFRRTFATRAVEEGAFPVELAMMLDHSDLQTVQVYYETRSNQVQRLDAALALKLAPLADAFMGRLVVDESEAVNGGNPAKRIPWFRRRPGQTPERNGNLGTCGAGACGLYAPISCYTCEKFQPWKNGPHREMLDWLCAERDRREKDGRDPQIVRLHDATILAVAEVVTLCEGAAE
ncbi:phage integrase family protein [Bradyrhizobium sp. R2.2-H]|jgi:integrase|uniref:tyrosine-type recombinase/integrase n=1 Tax=unclassified Bradyrhizobium TaxID=2631580 RepID=UPI00104F11CF|nr:MULTISPECIES: tyrosine-type recombinase/integrase [unclassified Bradyrhizobium]TCU75440.1 phage integrase family protein [Bradyrhizobium sp. Y-H1]TCU78208.1 phage integrase family protein [Bradyrhizobium sp. R2.2-H]